MASPPAANRDHGCKVTGGVRRGAAVKNRKNKEEQRLILDAIRAREKKRGEEEKLTVALRRTTAMACLLHDGGVGAR